MRIVLDTNVVISALLWRGTPHQLLGALATHPNTQLFSSPKLLEEISNVLSRPGASKQLAIVGKSARDVLADYLEVVELVEPSTCRASPAILTTTMSSLVLSPLAPT